MQFDINDVTVGRPDTPLEWRGLAWYTLIHHWSGEGWPGTHSYTIGVERAGLVHIHIPLEWRGLGCVMVHTVCVVVGK